jgi:hypothetical protein
VHDEAPPTHEDLDERLKRKVTAGSDAGVMAKDLHLVKAAFSHDRIIISMDEEARAAFTRNKKRLGLGEELAWVNPAAADDGEVGWLKRGAPREQSKKL